MRYAILLSTIVCFGCSDGTSDGGTPDFAIRPGADLSFPPGADLAGIDFAAPPGSDLATPTGPIQNVFIVLMENNNWASIKGSAQAPFINSLLPLGAHAENYKNPAGIHPSEPNYLWLAAGTNFAITDDNDPSANHQSSTAHIYNQLEAKGVSWKSYAEGIDGTTCPLTASGAPGEYVPKHVAAVFFDDITNTNDVNSTRCKAHVRPYSELATDLAAGTVAKYAFITPNLCDDMHGSDITKGDITCLLNLVKAGDDWLKANLQPMLNYANAHNGVVMILWDEGELNSDGPIGAIFLGPKVKTDGTKPDGYSNMIAYTHSSTLKSVQEIFGLTPLLGDAATAGTSDLSDLFTSFP